MKKVFLLFVMVFMSCQGVVHAQTKNSADASSLTINDFFYLSSADNYYYPFYQDAIISNIEKQGYKLTSSSKVKGRVWDDDNYEYVEGYVKKEVYSKDGNDVIFDEGDSNGIRFNSKSSLDAFINSMLKIGWEGSGNSYSWNRFNHGQPVGVTIEGLTLKFNFGE